ncbi:MAG TPA: hypothetical protein VMU16_00620, partial [Candidatus Binataceae bacterium]|nr:hypothetical protein [Candidatus Binataceae bacterium]
EHKGWLWYGLAVIIGGVVGFLCAWGMRAFGGEYARRFAAGPNVQEWRFRLLYLLASAWIILAAFIGGWVMQAVMHII